MLIRPDSAAAVADALHRASDARQSIVIRGAGSKSEWGRPAARVDAILDMRGLNRILAHEHGDMTATVEAGASLRDVNLALARHGQTLPLDPPFADRATIGGLLATNDSGPLRHRHGTPRDLVIGIQLATTDGALARAGGRVVKNVAGYDLSKLITGSFGSLAAIVEATFKLAPLPPASKTLRVGVRSADTMAAAVGTVMASQLEPVAFELTADHAPSEPDRHREAAPVLSLWLRFASLPAVVDAQIDQASDALKAVAASIDVLNGDKERAAWDAHAGAIWNEGAGAVVRVSWLPATIAAGVTEVQGIMAGAARGGTSGTDDAGASASAWSMAGRAGIGAGHLRIEGTAAAQAAVVERLRRSTIFGNVVVVRGSAELKALVDVWGSAGDRRPLFESLKRSFDPHGVLNAGRGPL